VLRQAQKKGFECYGLGIMCSNIATLLPHTSRVIETLPQLAPALFELLEGALRRNA
jgi:cobaltochelatase CobT